MKYSLNICAKFQRCKKGVTAIEFALIAPVLLMMVMGIIEISLVMYAQAMMEGAGFQGSRTGKTGYVETGKTQEQTILDTIQSRAGIFMNTANVSITSKAYSNFTNIEKPEPFVDSNGNGVRDINENYTDVNGNAQYDTDMGISGYGTGQSITVYTLTYPWVVKTPMINNFFPNGTITISARAVVKNEPY